MSLQSLHMAGSEFSLILIPLCIVIRRSLLLPNNPNNPNNPRGNNHNNRNQVTGMGGGYRSNPSNPNSLYNAKVKVAPPAQLRVTSLWIQVTQSISQNPNDPLFALTFPRSRALPIYLTLDLCDVDVFCDLYACVYVRRSTFTYSYS